MRRRIALLQDEIGSRKYNRVGGDHLEKVAKLLKERLAHHFNLLSTWMKEVELSKHEASNQAERDSQLERIIETSKVK